MSPRYSGREFEAHLAETLTLMRQEATPFTSDTPAKRAARLKRARKDHLFFAKTYLPHYFYEGFAPFHEEMSQAAQTPEQPVLIVSAGGFGKTSIVTIVEALHALLFKTHPFTVIGGMTEDVASQNTVMVRIELEENERVLQDFGVQRGDYRWEDTDLVTRAGCRLKARGVGQAFRGLRWRQHRPSLVLLDDIEDEELSVSSRRVGKALRWILSTVLPRLEARGWRMVLCANVLNRTGVVGSLLFHPDHKGWKRLIFPAEDKRGKPTWPERFSKAVLDKLKALQGFVQYSREMLCKPIDDAHFFRPEMTQFYPRTRVPDMRDIIVAVDPSVLASTQGDYKAIVGIGRVAKDDPREYICACWIRHATVDAMIAACYQIHEELHPKVFFLEGNGYQKHLKRDFDRWALKKGYSLPLAHSDTVESKDVRIERLVPLHDNGDILYCRELGDTPLLLEQKYGWEPRGREHDDGPDAETMAVEYRSGKRRQARFRAL